MQPVGYGLSSGHPAHETFRGPLCPPSHCAMSSGDLAGRQDPETFAFDGRTHRCIKFKGVYESYLFDYRQLDKWWPYLPKQTYIHSH